MKPEIDKSDLEKIDIRLGTIVECDYIAGSDKLLKLTVDFGTEVGIRTILTGMKAWYKTEDLKGLQTTFVLNLKPRRMMGIESQGMIFAAESVNGKPAFLQPNSESLNGTPLI